MPLVMQKKMTLDHFLAEKWYVYNVFTQILSDILLLAIISGQKNNFNDEFK